MNDQRISYTGDLGDDESPCGSLWGIFGCPGGGRRVLDRETMMISVKKQKQAGLDASHRNCWQKEGP